MIFLTEDVSAYTRFVDVLVTHREFLKSLSALSSDELAILAMSIASAVGDEDGDSCADFRHALTGMVFTYADPKFLRSLVDMSDDKIASLAYRMCDAVNSCGRGDSNV